MECRKCGACCIAPSISSPIPGMPQGKPANKKCIHLTENMECALWNKANRPQVCIKCRPDKDFCGNNFDEAISIYNSLE